MSQLFTIVGPILTNKFPAFNRIPITYRAFLLCFTGIKVRPRFTGVASPEEPDLPGWLTKWIPVYRGPTVPKFVIETVINAMDRVDNIISNTTL